MDDEPDTTNSVNIKIPDGSIVQAVIKSVPNKKGDRFRLAIKIPNYDLILAEDHHVECFSALISLREKLEPMGIKILCWGARKDVWPSSCQRDMGGGIEAYQLGDNGVFGPACNCIFDPTYEQGVASVDDQLDFAESWLKQHCGLPQDWSIRYRPGLIDRVLKAMKLTRS